MSVKITSLELENVKRIRAVSLEPAENGLTIIGGRNGQGKTSVLDAIAWGLGGAKFAPSRPTRDGSTIPAKLKITLSNGIVVERSGAKGALTVTDPSGKRAGQALLDSFIEVLALDMPRFMRSSEKDKAETLLKVIGVGDQLKKLDSDESDIYNRRRVIGQESDRRKKYADKLPFYPEAPNKPVSVSELIQEQQAILAKNGENQRKRERVQQIENELKLVTAQYNDIKKKLDQLQADFEAASKDAVDLHDESTEDLENSIRNAEQINEMVRANMERIRAFNEAEQYQAQYDALTKDLEGVRADRKKLLDGAKLPLPGLEVRDNRLTYNGQFWDGLSGSEQMIVSTAIVRAIKPQCGFVLVDKLEQLDSDSLKEFGDWAADQGLQIISTRVDGGGDCSIVIEDGRAVVEPGMNADPEKPAVTGWTPGKF